MISIVDYGSGNLNAIANVYNHLKVPYKIVSEPKDLKDAKKIILPGVGSFDHCMNKLNLSGLKQELNQKVLVDKVPVLGICIGLHLMMKKSEEGNLEGLGWLDGEVKRFDESRLQYKPKLPHMGWNSIKIQSSQELFKNIDEQLGFYFIHSYYVQLNEVSLAMTSTDYGGTFVSGVRMDNIYAVQFHPEKSHKNGVSFLKNFSIL